ncbi:MAG: hypothetical protein KAR79_05215, partial [Simkaniaceae bacterium]|nr:hypothetical protein [Simkaniaceae bacterium]
MSITELPLEVQAHIISYAGNPQIRGTCRGLHAVYEEHCRGLIAQFSAMPEPEYFSWGRIVEFSQASNSSKVAQIFQRLIWDFQTNFPDDRINIPSIVSIEGYHSLNDRFLDLIARDRVAALNQLPGGPAHLEEHRMLSNAEKAELLAPFITENQQALEAVGFFGCGGVRMLPPEILELNARLGIDQEALKYFPPIEPHVLRRLMIADEKLKIRNIPLTWFECDKYERRMITKYSYQTRTWYNSMDGSIDHIEQGMGLTAKYCIEHAFSIRSLSKAYEILSGYDQELVHTEIWHLA